MKKLSIVSSLALIVSVLCRIVSLCADTVPIKEEEVPVVVTTNVVNGVAQASAVISVPVDLSTPEATLTLSRGTNGHYRAKRGAKGPARGVYEKPPLPPMVASTLVSSEERVIWSDYPPEHVVVPKDPLPEGAKRQWSTTVHEDWTFIVWKGQTNRHSLGVTTLTNHMMRVVKPLLEISEPVPAIHTNSTNF